MTQYSHIAQSELQAVAVRRSLEWRPTIWRIGLVPLFVVLCYQFEWQAWRALVTSALLALSPWFEVPVVRLGFDSFICHGESYYIAIFLHGPRRILRLTPSPLEWASWHLPKPCVAGDVFCLPLGAQSDAPGDWLGAFTCGVCPGRWRTKPWPVCSTLVLSLWIRRQRRTKICWR